MQKKHVVIIDGYNVIHRDQALSSAFRKSLEQSRAGLARLCGMWLAMRRDVWKFQVVFDGSADICGGASSGVSGVEFVFHSKDKKADSRVIAMSEEGTSHYRYTVVSGDNEVTRACKRNGAEIMTPDDFIAGCRSSGGRAGRRTGEQAGVEDKNLPDKALHSINKGLLEQFERAHSNRKSGGR